MQMRVMGASQEIYCCKSLLLQMSTGTEDSNFNIRCFLRGTRRCSRGGLNFLSQCMNLRAER